MCKLPKNDDAPFDELVLDQKEEEAVRKHHTYVDRFVQPGEPLSEECRAHLASHPCFLPRSVRSYQTSPYGAVRSEKVKEMTNGDKVNTCRPQLP